MSLPKVTSNTSKSVGGGTTPLPWGKLGKNLGASPLGFSLGFPLLLSVDIDIIPSHFREYFALHFAEVITLLHYIFLCYELGNITCRSISSLVSHSD